MIFLDEARPVAMLDHQNIAPCLEVDVVEARAGRATARNPIAPAANCA
jgi:hypothetical protein